jgi:hypothetical protein
VLVKGPFAVIVKRVGGWWRVTGLYQGQARRDRYGGVWCPIARGEAGSCAERPEAVKSAKVLFNQMRAN